MYLLIGCPCKMTFDILTAFTSEAIPYVFLVLYQLLRTQTLIFILRYAGKRSTAWSPVLVNFNFYWLVSLWLPEVIWSHWNNPMKKLNHSFIMQHTVKESVFTWRGKTLKLCHWCLPGAWNPEGGGRWKLEGRGWREETQVFTWTLNTSPQAKSCEPLLKLQQQHYHLLWWAWWTLYVLNITCSKCKIPLDVATIMPVDF